MKHFLKQVFIVILGIFISLVLLVGSIAFLLRPSKPQLTDKTVLRIALHGRVVERANDTWIKLLQADQEEEVDLSVLKKAIKQAQEDKKIKGIYLKVDTLKAGWASLEEIREALLSFKKAGKFIIAYGEQYTQKTYYLASVADDIVLNSAGTFSFQGLHQTVFFYKSLFEKLEITPQVFRVGNYKSGVEPFIRQDMSPASRHQSTVLLKKIYDHFLQQIAKARTLKKASLEAIVDKLSVVLPQDAHRAKLVTQIGHEDSAEALVKAKLGVDEKADIHYLSCKAYSSLKKRSKTSKNQVAILIAEGPIVDGESEFGAVGAKDLVADLRAAREDDNIKAIVLRINSPGGSALASDVLWQEIMLTKAQKPVVASLSDVAASGGYCLATACDRIVAQPTTITGSIGIFGLFFDVNVLLKNKLGITTDVIKLGSSADFLNNPGRSFTVHEKAVIQRILDSGYVTFLERVATGRDMSLDDVKHVASGRVWSGIAAQKHNLVDDLGDLEDAIRAAAELAAIHKDYMVSYWPKPHSLYEQIFKSDSNKKRGIEAFTATMPVWRSVQSLIYMRGIQARLPYELNID